MRKRLDNDRLSVLLSIAIEHITHEVIDALIGLFAEFYPLLDLLTRRGVVLLVVVEIRVHEQLHDLEDLNIEVLGMLDQFEELYTDVDVR